MSEGKYNQAVQDALSDYATERSTARQTQKILKSLGYRADLSDRDWETNHHYRSRLQVR